MWDKLKEILNIKTNEFDAGIKTFIEKENVFESSNRLYYEIGIAPTLTMGCGRENIIVSCENKEEKRKEHE